jgi:hypothetical protein
MPTVRTRTTSTVDAKERMEAGKNTKKALNTDTGGKVSTRGFSCDCQAWRSRVVRRLFRPGPHGWLSRPSQKKMLEMWNSQSIGNKVSTRIALLVYKETKVHCFIIFFFQNKLGPRLLLLYKNRLWLQLPWVKTTPFFLAATDVMWSCEKLLNRPDLARRDRPADNPIIDRRLLFCEPSARYAVRLHMPLVSHTNS